MRVEAGLRRTVDIVFPKQKLAIFVDGCFWHDCEVHGRRPKTNAEYWRSKVVSNRRRDCETNRELQARGWTVLRFWEHDDPAIAAAKVKSTLSALRSQNEQVNSRNSE